MDQQRYSYEQLTEMCDRLQQQVSRHIMVEQDLIKTRDQLDRELARFKTLQSYHDRALKADSLDELTTLSLEAIIEAFEFESAALLRIQRDSGKLEPLGRFGMPRLPDELDFDEAWLAGDESVIVDGDHPMLQAWSELGLMQAIVCPFHDRERNRYGVIVGGRSQDQYDEITDALKSAFSVMVQQVGALWLNYHLNVDVRERKYRVLFHRSNDAVLLVDLSGRILDTNQRALEMFGYDREQMTAMEVSELAVEAEREESRAAFKTIQDTGSIRIERCCLHSDGHWFPAEVSASIFDLDGKPMVHGLIRDITELKQSQQQLILSERMAALGQLVAGVAHEINTPVGVIRASVNNIDSSLGRTLEQLPDIFRTLPDDDLAAFLALLGRARECQTTLSAREERRARRSLGDQLEEAGVPDAESVAETLVGMGVVDGVEPFIGLLSRDDPRLLEAAYSLSSLQRNSRNISTAVERASKVVFALKKFAHHDHSGKQTASDLADGIETVLTLYQNLLKQGVEVVRQFEPLPAIPCYPDELNQVWTNLLHNALQAMDNRGRIVIGVRRDGEAAVVTVCDDGPGIPDELQERIFEPFFTTKAAGEGSGLGLDICRRIVERHHGSMTVDSEPGRTEFTIRLPIAGAADEGAGGETG